MIILQHVYLIGWWTLFCVLHSLLATRWWKLKMSRLFGKSFRYYRFYYSIFATLGLSALLYFQIKIQSPVLWRISGFMRLAAVLSGIAGIAVMLVCMKKYFFVVSGIKAFSRERNSVPVLLMEGLHSYVRHPLYLGTLLFIWSVFLLFPILSNLISCSLISAYTIVGIHIEERKLINEFGECYKIYAQKVPMLIPVLFLRRAKLRRSVPEVV